MPGWLLWMNGNWGILLATRCSIGVFAWNI